MKKNIVLCIILVMGKNIYASQNSFNIALKKSPSKQLVIDPLLAQQIKDQVCSFVNLKENEIYSMDPIVEDIIKTNETVNIAYNEIVIKKFNIADREKQKYGDVNTVISRNDAMFKAFFDFKKVVDSFSSFKLSASSG